MAGKPTATGAVASPQGTQNAGGMRISTWLQGVACGMLFILATPTAVLAMCLLMPALLSFVADREPGRPVTRAVLLFGSAGSCAPFVALWRTSHGMADMWLLVGDIRTLAIAWSAQALGWLIAEILPFLMGLIGEAQTRIEINRMQKRREALMQEWHSTD